MPTSSLLSAFAEAPDRYTDLSPDVERFADERVCIVQGATWAAVSDVHVAPAGVEPLLAETRRLIAADKSTTWWIGPSSEPPDLYERLQALGLGEPPDRASVLHALASETEPPPIPDGIEVRRVESFDDFVLAAELGWDAFGIAEERRERERAHLRSTFRSSVAVFLAFVGGEPAGVGRSVLSRRGVFLIGGAVLPQWRGRGVYRALVRARWDHAVERGTPGMVVEAMPDTSYPILLKLGFEQVCVVRRLQDLR